MILQLQRCDEIIVTGAGSGSSTLRLCGYLPPVHIHTRVPSSKWDELAWLWSGEVLQYVHQLKTINNKAVKKKDAKFIHTSTENQAVNDVYAALLKGEPITKHIILNAMNVGSDDSSSEYLD
ncbi:uncharacterized protein LOC126426434 [Schistocerca serialis cubense]|uniref:uncharacterized protein LOC126426434 n=1 Tax=Schistocerca serialis cubense TaxID=2023355 RepID=UPI00214E6D58|nr:uncharacterized protein LOC126426434 [Schistocerca serialis cubense]